MTKKNNLYINIKDDDSELATLVDFLRDGEISSRSIAAIKAFYLSLAISKSPASTREDIRKAEHYCLSQLKQQMIYIMDKHYRDDGIEMNADEFSTVTINQSSSLSQPLNSNGVISQDVSEVSQNENRQIIGQSISKPLGTIIDDVDLKVIDASKSPDSLVVVEEDEDDYDNMTKEEYAAAMLKLMVMPDVKPS
jgi:hypothetical protein